MLGIEPGAAGSVASLPTVELRCPLTKKLYEARNKLMAGKRRRKKLVGSLKGRIKDFFSRSLQTFAAIHGFHKNANLASTLNSIGKKLASTALIRFEILKYDLHKQNISKGPRRPHCNPRRRHWA